jgi:hypothetical protein
MAGGNIPGATGPGGGAKKSPFGMNFGTLDLVLGGINTIGGLWAAWQQNKLAKEQLKMQTEMANINVANQISAYNTALEDKTRHRASYMEEDPATTEKYLASHKLEERQIG